MLTSSYGNLDSFVNMGYWPTFILFLLVYVPRDRSEVHKQTKKELGQYPSILIPRLAIKELLYGKGTFFSGTQRVIPSKQDSSIFPPRVANHSEGFSLFCLLTIKVNLRNCRRSLTFENIWKGKIVWKNIYIRTNKQNVQILVSQIVSKKVPNSSKYFE